MLRRCASGSRRFEGSQFLLNVRQCRKTQCHIPEDLNAQKQRCQNLRLHETAFLSNSLFTSTITFDSVQFQVICRSKKTKLSAALRYLRNQLCSNLLGTVALLVSNTLYTEYCIGNSTTLNMNHLIILFNITPQIMQRFPASNYHVLIHIFCCLYIIPIMLVVIIIYRLMK